MTTKHYARRVVGRDVQIAEALDVEFRQIGSGANGTLMHDPRLRASMGKISNSCRVSDVRVCGCPRQDSNLRHTV